MSNDLWRWADPDGQQRRVRLDELRAALAGGLIAPNTPVWRAGWKVWQSAHEVPELTSSALSAANGVVPNIPPPPLAMLAHQHAFESKAGGSFSPPAMPVQNNDEPPPPPHYVPLPTKATSIPPGAPSSGRLPSLAPPAAGSAPSVGGVGPGGPMIHSSLPTTIGLPPPPEIVALANAQKAAAAPPPPVAHAPVNGGHAKDPMIEELSGSMLLDDSQPGLAPSPRRGIGGDGGFGGHGAGGMPPPTDPVIRGDDGRASMSDDDVAGLPPRRPGLTLILDDLNEMKAGRPPKNKLLVGVVAVVALSVLISLLALVVSLFRGKPSELPEGTTARAGSSTASGAGSGSTAAATGTSKSTATAATPVPAPTPAATTETKPASGEPSLGDCTMAGEAHVVSPRAFMPAGVEAVAVPGAIALGFAIDPRNGVGVTVDPASIGITTTVKARALGGDARRMSPILEKGKLTLVPGVDKKFDKLVGRRVVATNPPIDIGIAEGALVWAPHDQNSYAKVVALEGEGMIDAIRAVPLASNNARGIAFTFRRGNAVYVGVAKGDSVLNVEGPLSRIPGLGQVGSPAIATSGDTILVAWSDRATAQEPWQVRWTKLAPGGAPDAPKQMAIPDGGLGTQAMSPSMAGLGAGRFVMAWSEGTPTHQVRAMTMNADGSPSGTPMALSAAGVNAGQPQVAIGPDGRGVVGFLAAKGKAAEIHATPVACSTK
ncbi:MAG: Basic proline-rich protein [Labilithrix sp.]|nr:Basic proline-rich protein [Labilithrix sp.]